MLVVSQYHIFESYKTNIYRAARQAIKAGGIHSLESIPGIHKRLKIRALYSLDCQGERVKVTFSC